MINFTKQLPKINFFQYPPMEPFISVEHDSFFFLEKKLALSKQMPKNLPFSVFVFIPYCQSHCNSCVYFKNLLSINRDGNQGLDDYVDYLSVQMQKYGATKRFSSALCGAIYLGGGTASLLSPKQVGCIVANLKKYFNMKKKVEITLEGNPHHFTLEYLQDVKKQGITRISVGFQSGDIKILRTVGCIHNTVEAVQAVNNAVRVGFKTVNMDLLYRVPGQTHKQWIRDLYKAVQLNPTGIALYEYIVHPHSNAERFIADGILPCPVNKDIAHEWYLRSRSFLQNNGFIEHRKGGFSKSGHMQQYGTISYDKGYEIVGLGAGAYSYINGYQFQSPDNPESYKKMILDGFFVTPDRLSERASKQNLMERFVIFSFFSSKLNRSQFYKRFGKDPLEVFPKQFSKFKDYELVKIGKKEIRFTDLGVRWRSNIFYEFYAKKFKKIFS